MANGMIKKNNETKLPIMKKEDELKELEKEYEALSKRCVRANLEYDKLENEISNIIHRIDNLTKDVWEEKAKSLTGKYIAWKEGDLYFFFHVVQSNKFDIIGEMIFHYYNLFNGNMELSEIRYKTHRRVALNDIDRDKGIEKLKEGTLYKEITEEEFNLRKTTPIYNTEE